MFKRFNYTLGVAWMVAVFVLPFPFLWTFINGLSPAIASEKLAISFGIMAYVWMLFAIYVGTKPKWIDRLIGLPVAYMIHGILSLVAIALSFFHKTMLPSEGLVAQTGNLAFLLFLGLAIYSLVFMAGWLTSRLPFLAQIKKKLEKIFRHEVSIWLHRLNLLATFLVFLHVQLIDYIRSNTSFMLLFYGASIFVFGTYLWKKIQPNALGVKARLVSNQKIGENIHELTIQLPKSDKQSYRPGDFIFISFPHIKGLEEPHPFSLVNDPRDGQELVLAIRGDGDFTRQLQDISAPSHLYVDGGYGQYQAVIDEQKPKEILAIAGGIGITPILSVIEAHPHIRTRVFHGSSTEAGLVYASKFIQWKERSNFQADRKVGRYLKEDILPYLPDQMDHTLVLLSGLAAMARYWIKVLMDNGLSKQQIIYEEFGW